MLIECPTVLWANTTIARTPPIARLVLVTTWDWVTSVSVPTSPLSCKNIILTAGSGKHDMSVNVTVLKKFSNSPSDWHVSWVQFGFRVQLLSQSGFTLAAIWSRSHTCGFDTATENIIIILNLWQYRHWSRKLAWKVADGVATHSKLYWCKGGGWLIMVDVSYTTLHKISSEEGWLATLSTPLDQPLQYYVCKL